MGKNSNIAWTDHTFNPWWGCTNVSPGCDHCYAEAFSKRFGFDVWGRSERRFFGDDHWNEPLKWEKEAAESGCPRRVMCGSMMDFCEDNPVLDGERARLGELVDLTPHLRWLFLSKRPQNYKRMLPENWLLQTFPSTVWIGTTVENVENVKRMEFLKQLKFDTGCHIWVSAEPLLGPVYLDPNYYGIEWVIVGGESGAGCRPMYPWWATEIKVQCQRSGIPFFFKQMGGYPNKRDVISEWPMDLQLQQVPETMYLGC